MHLQEISIKKGVYNYLFDNLVKKSQVKKIGTTNILIDKKRYKDLRICSQQVNKNAQPALS